MTHVVATSMLLFPNGLPYNILQYLIAISSPCLSRSFITVPSIQLNLSTVLPDMDLFEELESMAVNKADDYDAEFEPSEDEIQRWQTLFAYSYSEAVEQIKNQKSDYSRYRVSTDHWDLVKSEKEAQGYSRDAYEHWIQMGGQSASFHGEPNHIIDTSLSQAETSYLILPRRNTL